MGAVVMDTWTAERRLQCGGGTITHPPTYSPSFHPSPPSPANSPPGTGKTLLARALASNIQATFLKVLASAIVDKYIGESARVIREMFGYAREHQPCVIFMDEVDAIGGSRFSEGEDHRSDRPPFPPFPPSLPPSFHGVCLRRTDRASQPGKRI